MTQGVAGCMLRSVAGCYQRTQSDREYRHIIAEVPYRVFSVASLFLTLLAVSAAPAPLSAQTAVPFTHIIIDSKGPTDPWGKAVGDINGDGKIDLLVGGQTAGGLVWYENPTWVKHTISTAARFQDGPPGRRRRS